MPAQAGCKTLFEITPIASAQPAIDSASVAKRPFFLATHKEKRRP
jgi:hypothetical protein